MTKTRTKATTTPTANTIIVMTLAWLPCNAAGIGEAFAQSSPPQQFPVVLIRSKIAQGLDGLMPRHGVYERALDAAAHEQYRLAEELFGDAAADRRQQALVGGVADDHAADLIRKALFEAEQARIAAESQPIGTPLPTTSHSPEYRLRVVLAIHNLYLADRAFHGKDRYSFRARVETLYRSALAPPKDGGVPPISSAWPHFQLGYAALLADAGDLTAAAAAYASVPESERSADVVDLVAHYEATAGHFERALDALYSARDTLPDWPSVAAVLRVSNDLDPVRDDPRVRRLLHLDD